VPAATQRRQKAFKTNTSFNPIPEGETAMLAKAAGKVLGDSKPPEAGVKALRPLRGGPGRASLDPGTLHGNMPAI
jgi:hypothetical protein